MENILKKVINLDSNFFITGKAGTGKTTLSKLIIKEILEKEDNIVVLAPTGIAAINIGGTTIHSFFKFSGDIIPQKANELGEKSSGEAKYNKLDYILIDEISMVRSDLLDSIDNFLRKARENNKAFGGVKMIFVGDLYQLPPVVLNKEKNIFFKKYKTSFFYSSDVFFREKFKLELIELKKVYRQEKSNFLDILNNIRIGNVSLSDLKYLNKAKNHNFTDKHIIITTTNKLVREINNKKFNELKNGDIFKFKMKIKGKVDNLDIEKSILEKELKLKKDARIMFLANDINKSFVNGTLGIIKEINNYEITIKIDNGKNINLKVNDYKENIFEYIYDFESNKIIKRIRGHLIQLPIKLAWAITIHKSQGMTYKNISLNFGEKGCWAPGQAYVALSRVQSFKGLHLQKEINLSDINSDSEIDIFLKQNINSSNSLDLKTGLKLENYEKEIFFGDKGGIDYFNIAKLIIKKINLEGAKAYIVGGFCRNKIKGITSFTDIDISTDLIPKKIKKLFNVVNNRAEDYGMLIIKEYGFTYEITTFRYDINRKQVLFSNRFKEDANRRDFTINAIYLNPITGEYTFFNNLIGKQITLKETNLINYYLKNKQNPIADLEDNIIRFIGSPSDRIEEDPIRLLRYVRFKYSLKLKDFDIEQYDIVKRNFSLIKNVAFERIKLELEKIFIGDNVVKSLKELKDLGFFKIFIPEIDKLEECPGGPKYHLEGDVWKHTLKIIDYLEKQNIKDTSIYWIALFHDTGKTDTYNIRKDGSISYIGHEEESFKIFQRYINKLKFTKKEIKKISWIIKKHLRFGLISKMRDIKKAELFLNQYWESFYIFCDADNNGRIPVNKKTGEEIQESYKNFIDKYNQITLINGDDIRKKYPDLSGKDIGKRLKQINDKIILEKCF